MAVSSRRPGCAFDVALEVTGFLQGDLHMYGARTRTGDVRH